MTISVSYRFDDATVLITGAGSGIGAALARYCARAGASVIAIDRRHDNLLRNLDPALRSKVDLRQVDVANESAVAALLDDVGNKYPRLDAAVLAAAIQVRTNVDDMTASQWREVIDTNLNSVFYCLHGIIPRMKMQRSGAIVAFTSGLALTGWPGASAYAASKAALIGMMKSAAQELKDSDTVWCANRQLRIDLRKVPGAAAAAEERRVLRTLLRHDESPQRHTFDGLSCPAEQRQCGQIALSNDAVHIQGQVTGRCEVVELDEAIARVFKRRLRSQQLLVLDNQLFLVDGDFLEQGQAIATVRVRGLQPLQILGDLRR